MATSRKPHDDNPCCWDLLGKQCIKEASSCMSLVCFQILAISRPALWHCWILCVAFCWTASAGGVESNKSRSRSVSKLVDASAEPKSFGAAIHPFPQATLIEKTTTFHNLFQFVPVEESQHCGDLVAVLVFPALLVSLLQLRMRFSPSLGDSTGISVPFQFRCILNIHEY